MEVYSKTTRFTLACNNSDQIIGVFVCQCVCNLYVYCVCVMVKLSSNSDVLMLVFTIAAIYVCLKYKFHQLNSNSAVTCYWWLLYLVSLS